MNSRSPSRGEAKEKLTLGPKRESARVTELADVPPSLEESSSSSSSGDGLSEKGRGSYEDTFPDGGRGWIVVLGCFIFSAATVGWGYVLSPCATLGSESLLIREPASPRASLVSYTVFCCFHAELLNPGCSPDPVQVWGVTEEYFREHMFPGTPDSVLTTLGSMSCLVSMAIPARETRTSEVPTQPVAQIMTIVGIVAGKLADR